MISQKRTIACFFCAPGVHRCRGLRPGRPRGCRSPPRPLAARTPPRPRAARDQTGATSSTTSSSSEGGKDATSPNAAETSGRADEISLATRELTASVSSRWRCPPGPPLSPSTALADAAAAAAASSLASSSIVETITSAGPASAAPAWPLSRVAAQARPSNSGPPSPSQSPPRR